MLVVDDAHWADGPSLRFLHYLAARVEDLPVAVLAGVRTQDPAARDPLVRRLTGAGEVVRLGR